MVARKKKPVVAALSLTVRNIPRPIFERLRDRAARHKRSMQGEILAILEVAASDQAVRRTALETLQHVRSLGVATPAEAVEMIRVERDGR